MERISLGFRNIERLGKLEVFKKGNRYYYYSKRALRMIPIKKSEVEQSEVA